MPSSGIRSVRTELDEILPLRNLFLQQNKCQIRYNACHERGWSDSYILKIENEVAGYGSVKGKEDPEDRDSLFEYFILPQHKKFSYIIFRNLIKTSKVRYIECQTNEPLLFSMLFHFSRQIHAEAMMFRDDTETNLKFPELKFRMRENNDIIFEHHSEPAGNYVLTKAGEIIATGGILLHYNFPFADLHMEVNEKFRRQGFGSFLLQELKKECYRMGRVPAARCNIENKASMNTLFKAGFDLAGYLLTGIISQKA
jgi:GNAT superfamily N-acetyltransferase